MIADSSIARKSLTSIESQDNVYDVIPRISTKKKNLL